MTLNKNLGRHIKTLVSLLMVATLSYFAAVIGIKLLEFVKPDELRVSVTKTDNGKGVNNGQKISADKIAELHLFGDPAKKKARKKPKKVKPKKVAPQTKLKLELAGILLPVKEEEGYALIKNRVKKSAVGVYRVGDRVVGSSVLKELHADHVIIRHNGRNESLWLTRNKDSWKGVSFDFSGPPEIKSPVSLTSSPREELSSGDGNAGGTSQQSSPASSADSRSKSQRSASAPSASEADNSSGDNSGGDGNGAEANEEMAQLRQELGELNPEVIRDLQPSFRPYVVKGRLQGFLVSRHGPYRDLLLAHGLRVGDVITKVNNIPMTHSVRKQLIENKNRLIEAGSLDLQVLRGGRELPMTVRF